ncbi:MAG: alpha-L-rhamnosidase [Planctomycetes bacterium]|nr:alpha-L-rhamnosidase [Planctomycetota bacterium]
MRRHIPASADPFRLPLDGQRVWSRGCWPASWVDCPSAAEEVLFRRRFTWPGGVLRLHLSADQRYQAFLDGRSIGRGPERGDLGQWHYESHDIDLPAGEHLLVARVWCLPMPPFAQLSHRLAWLCAAEGVPAEVLNTGHAAWEVRPDASWRQIDRGVAWGCGTKVEVTVDAGFAAAALGGGDGWMPVRTQAAAAVRWHGREPGQRGERQLTPARLPAQEEVDVRTGTVRHVADRPAADPVHASDCIGGEVAGWQALLDGSRTVTLPPRTRRLVLIDLGHYRCAYPMLTASGTGRVRMEWAEALYAEATGDRKTDRAAIEGRWFRGVGDEFVFTGAEGTATTLWWESGRFVRLLVEAGEAPLVLRSLSWLETGYPLRNEAAWTSADAGFDASGGLMERVLRRCAHETYMDCPYYEQLQYVGDTRLECLATRAITRDHKLPDKAVACFAWSLDYRGQLCSRYPCCHEQNIPGFSMLWIGMLHDVLMYGDPAVVRQHLTCMRSVREAFRLRIADDGSVSCEPGWNFVDWVPSWRDGEPPGAEAGSSAVIAWLQAYVLGLSAEIEAWAGEAALAERDRAAARRIAAGCEAFWDEARGLYRDTAGGATLSEHAQILALLSGQVPAHRAARMLDGLATAPDLARTTVYFSHYLFEVAARFRRPELLLPRLSFWSGLAGQGFTTVPEAPEPSRSDCHAWGAHPLFHRTASILGIRPAAPGYAAVRISPMLGTLAHAAGSWPHPLGDIRVEIRGAHGRVELPAGLPGTLVLDGREVAIPGTLTW